MPEVPGSILGADAQFSFFFLVEETETCIAGVLKKSPKCLRS